MKESYSNIERRGLPGGPNEEINYANLSYSTEGYKRFSPDVNNPFNIINSGRITMKDVDFPVTGVDNLGHRMTMMPDEEYEFPGNEVLEIPHNNIEMLQPYPENNHSNVHGFAGIIGDAVNHIGAYGGFDTKHFGLHGSYLKPLQQIAHNSGNMHLSAEYKGGNDRLNFNVGPTFNMHGSQPSFGVQGGLRFNFRPGGEIEEYNEGGLVGDPPPKNSFLPTSSSFDPAALNKIYQDVKEQEKIQHLPEQQIYATPESRKKYEDVYAKAQSVVKAFPRVAEYFTKNKRYKDQGIEGVSEYIQDITNYQKDAEDYYKARQAVKRDRMSTANFEKAYRERGWQRFDSKNVKTSEEDQKELEETWYGPTDEQGRRYWMDNPMNVSKVAQVVAAGAVLGPGAVASGIAAPVGYVLSNPLVQAGLTGYGVYDATTNTLPEAYRDFSEGRYLEGLGNVGMAALDLAPIPLFGTNLLGEASQAGKFFTKQLPSSPNAVDFSKYLTQEEAVAARSQRLISQKNKPGWNEQLTPELEQRLSTAVERHNPASEYAGEKLGTNTMGRTSTEVSRHPINADKLNPNSSTYDPNAVPIYLNDANKARVAAHETGHYYANSPEEGAEWLSHFDFSKLRYKTRTYLRGKRFSNADEIRERAAQLKDYIAQKNGIPLNQDFKITQAQLDDAIANYVKDTGLDNSMSKMLGALTDKKGLLKTMNKYALGTVPVVIGAAASSNEYKQGGNLFQNGGEDPPPRKILNNLAKTKMFQVGGGVEPAQAFDLSDLYMSPSDLEYLNKSSQEKGEYYCDPSGVGCLGSSFDAYDKIVGQRYPSTDFMSEAKLKEQAGFQSAKGYNYNKSTDEFYKIDSPDQKFGPGSRTYNWIKNDPAMTMYNDSDDPVYDFTTDSWDVHAKYVDAGGKNIYTRTDDQYLSKPPKAALDAESLKKLYSQITPGTIIGFGSRGNDGYNKSKGMATSGHSTQVVGYDERGVPVIYDYGKYRPLDDPYMYKIHEISNITIPKDHIGKNLEWAREKGYYKGDEPKDLNLNLEPILSIWGQDDDELPDFYQALKDYKFNLMDDLKIREGQYDQMAAALIGISMEETGGGGGPLHNIEQIIPGTIAQDTSGLTQLMWSNISDDEKLKKIAEKYGITKQSDLKDSRKSAIASMIYGSRNYSAAQKNLEEGKKEGVRTYYPPGWKGKIKRLKGDDQVYDGNTFTTEGGVPIDLLTGNNWAGIGWSKSIDDIQEQLDAASEEEGMPGRYTARKTTNDDGDEVIVIDKKTIGNVDMDPMDAFIYNWNSPYSLRSGDAQGGSGYVKNVKGWMDKIKMEAGGEITPKHVQEKQNVLDQELSKLEEYNLNPAQKMKLTESLISTYNDTVPYKFRMGGPTLSPELQTYKDYIVGKDESEKARKNYDKLNRVYYREAKIKNMMPANFIMTELIS